MNTKGSSWGGGKDIPSFKNNREHQSLLSQSVNKLVGIFSFPSILFSQIMNMIWKFQTVYGLDYKYFSLRGLIESIVFLLREIVWKKFPSKICFPIFSS